MENRQLSPLDQFLSGIGSALRAATSARTRASRPNPAADVPETNLSAGHAAVARNPGIEQQMQAAADEELDHLGWCEERLGELGSSPSNLRPVWYAGAWVMGAASGVLGDKWSLGFIEETERQVSAHLTGHLDRLPEKDAKSRAIVKQMRDEEERHGANARMAGAAELPGPVRELMRLTAKVMTGTAYWI